MNTYTIKKLVKGRVIGQEPETDFVAVPSVNYDTGVRLDDGLPFRVRYQGQEMTINDFRVGVAYRKFGDRLNRGTYTLGYFYWRPDET